MLVSVEKVAEDGSRERSVNEAYSDAIHLALWRKTYMSSVEPVTKA